MAQMRVSEVMEKMKVLHMGFQSIFDSIHSGHDEGFQVITWDTSC